MPKKKIIIADDHPIVRKGLKDILAEITSAEVVAEAENGFELMDIIGREKYDLLILDITMPGMSGLDALRHINTLYGKIPTLVFSIYSEDNYAIRFLQAGASGYVNKESDATVIIEAVNTVLMGGMYFSRDILEKYATISNNNFDQSPHERLSNREYEIMLLMAKGKRMSEIAEELAISAKTVSTHKSRIFEKMNFSSSSDLIKYAIDSKIL